MNFTVFDRAYLKNFFDYDGFEHYLSGDLVSGLYKGYLWSGSFYDKSGLSFPGLQSYDDFQSYINGSLVSGLNGGTGWLGAWFDKVGTGV